MRSGVSQKPGAGSPLPCSCGDAESHTSQTAWPRSRPPVFSRRTPMSCAINTVVGLVIAQVIVVAGDGVVVGGYQVSRGIQAAARLHRERPELWCPTRSARSASIERAPAGRAPSPGTPLRIRRHPPPCGRSPAVLPSRPRALSRAAFRETRRRPFASCRISYRSNRRSSGHSTDRRAHGPG